MAISWEMTHCPLKANSNKAKVRGKKNGVNKTPVLKALNSRKITELGT